MPAVYLFNADQDLALAHGDANYTAPPFARQLSHDLRLLPAWLAPAGSLIAVADAATAARDNRWLAERGLQVRAIAVDEVWTLGDEAQLRPWGWNATLCRLLHQAGATADVLPTREELSRWRAVAHRRTTIAMHRRMTALLGKPLCPTPVELSDLDAVRQFIGRCPGGAYLKMPWSGSGRGICHVLDADADHHAMRWAEGAIRHQGSLLCEQGLERVQDCAVEFQCHAGRCTVTGLSVFDSDFHSQYGGGVIDSQKRLHTLLASQCAELDTVVAALSEALEAEVAPVYDGVLGVDMMVYRDTHKQLSLNPCVEINLRHTMGMVAASLGEVHGLRGTFNVGRLPLPTDAVALTPVEAASRYAAFFVPLK